MRKCYSKAGSKIFQEVMVPFSDFLLGNSFFFFFFNFRISQTRHNEGKHLQSSIVGFDMY